MDSKSIEIKLVSGKDLLPDHLVENSKNYETYVTFKIGEEVKESSCKRVSKEVIWNELLYFLFHKLSSDLLCTVNVKKTTGRKKKETVGSFSLSLKRKFIENVPLTIMDQRLKGPKNYRGALTISITTRNFGEKPDMEFLDKVTQDFRPRESTELLTSSAEAKKKKFKWFKFTKSKTVDNPGSMKEDQVLKIETQQKLEEMKVQDTPCRFGSKFAGLYSGKVLPYKNNKFLYPVGNGLLKLPNKTMIYSGSFQNGRRNGKGKLFLCSNIKVFIECFWKNGLPFGKTLVTYHNSDYYYGEVEVVSNDHLSLNPNSFQKSGLGFFYCKSKNYSYYGYYKNDLRNGPGICDYNNTGERYTGTWGNDEFHGQGCYNYLDGSLYTGEFTDQKKMAIENKGTIFLSNGYEIQGKIKTSESNKSKISGFVVSTSKVANKNLSNMSLNVLKTLKHEIKDALSFKNNSSVVNAERCKLLWKNILKRRELKSEILKLQVKFGREIFSKIDKTIVQYLLQQEEGYLCSFLKFFCEYFNNNYCEETHKKAGKRLKLLYAKTDVETFIEFIHNEICEITESIKSQFLKENINKVQKRDKKRSTVPTNPKSPKKGLHRRVNTNLFSSSNAGSTEAGLKNFRYKTIMQEIDEIDENMILSNEQIKPTNSKPDSTFWEVKTIVKSEISNFIQCRIFKVLFKMYLRKYKQKQILLNNKISSIRHSFSKINVKEKYQLLLNQIKELRTLDLKDYQKLEIEGMKNILESIVFPEKNKKGGGNYKNKKELERKFVANFLKSLKINFRFLKDKKIVVDNELMCLNEVTKGIPILNSKKMSDSASLEFYRGLGDNLRRLRILFSSLFKIKEISDFSEFFKDPRSFNPSNYSSFQIDSINNEIDGLTKFYESLLKPTIKTKKFELLKVDITNINLIIDSIMIQLKTFESPSYVMMSELKKSVNIRIQVIENVLNFMNKPKQFESLLLKLNKCKLGNIKMIKKNSKDINSKLNKLEKSLNKDCNWNFIKMMWGSIYRCQQIGFVFKNKTFQLMDIICQVKTIEEIISLKRVLNDPQAKYFFDSFGKFTQAFQNDIDFISGILMDETQSQIKGVNVKVLRESALIKHFLSFKKSGKKGFSVDVLLELLFRKCDYLKSFFNSNCSKKKRTDKKRSEDNTNFQQLFLKNTNSLFQIFVRKLNFFNVKITTKEEERRKRENFQKHFSNSIVNLLIGVKSIILNINCERILQKIEIDNLSKFLSDSSSSVDISWENTEIGKILDNQKKQLINLSITKKIELCENMIYSGEFKIGDIYNYVNLQFLGCSSKFIPSQSSATKMPYSKSIAKLNTMREGKSVVKKMKILRDFEYFLQMDMKKIFQQNMKKEKKLLEEDDILPISLYVFLNSSELNHFAEYNYLNDWKFKMSKMLMRYSIFFKYCDDLDPYTRNISNNKLLSVLGNILTPVVSIIQNLLFNYKHLNLEWLINLLNFIYCEVGWIPQVQKTSSSSSSKEEDHVVMAELKINNAKLRKQILKNWDIQKIVLVENVIGFKIVFDEDDIEPENSLRIIFHNVYSPQVYKWCANGILKEFKELFN